MFSKTLMGLSLISLPVWAANVPSTLEATTPGNIPTTAGAVSNPFVSASTVVTVTVPYFADTYLQGGDPLWVCDKPTRCGTTFPTSTVSSTGWVFYSGGRKLSGNLQQSTSLIYVYARPQDMVSTSQPNIGSFEWSSQATSQ